MKFRIMKKKLIFFKYLQQCDKNYLANEIFEEQERLKLPGLVKESKILAKELNIDSDLNNKEVTLQKFEQIVKQKIAVENENEVRSMMTKSKCDDIKGEKFGLKSYFKNHSVTNARTKFRFKTKMTHFRDLKQLW